ncbi:HAD family acid phosphatase [Thalassotalea sp. 1_MG-2023]|uniref:HAD family acid phosphatase n=1 Tax=Thalassotalea sp. 1_MG-2023 TaxID=3062680 RepID=UPI0026E2EB21|nr:HAD family acid phosphatase [Thalassotalea sp. 1_MG-2023]MDO6426856.1 HAD family acid phosphatase [Thalassotalea sp. 1_MG-2023]
MTLNRLLVGLTIGTLSMLTTACSTSIKKQATTPVVSTTTAQTKPQGLVVATWNTEHLAFPISDGCRARTEAETTQLKQYAKSLNADIVALQEVASSEAVELLFPKSEWNIIISTRADSKTYDCRKTAAKSTQQKVAFVVRKDIEILNTKAFDALALQRPGLRYGLELTINSPFGAMTLLNVHMKSGCFVDNYSRADSDACNIFAQQAPLLDKWAEKKERTGMPYMILGDFNHRLSAPYNHLTRQLSANENNSTSSLENLGADIIGCHPYYPAPIDHILAGNMPEKGLQKTVTMHYFDDMSPKAMLSDHCALSVELSNITYPLSTAVKWQTTSKEYSYLTSVTYKRATEALENMALPKTSWAVVMDVDETVLDNSQYQVNIEKQGESYSPKTWRDWVASEKATLVPGVKAFIQSVFQQGGKLALITNRDSEQDNHTWNNLRALGIPVTTDNTCVMGRTSADKAAIDGVSIINDKDLRRQKIQNGTANCYTPNGSRTSLFPELTIIMQVGDNIEDFSGVTQEEADVKALLPRANGELILLPNPMYGSW